MTARFWEYTDAGLVRLALREGQTLRHWAGGPDDEGWWSEARTWSLADGVVIRETIHDGRDCDGRLTRYHNEVCPVADLALEPAYDAPGYLVPAWQEAGSSQQDEFAEAMGY